MHGDIFKIVNVIRHANSGNVIPSIPVQGINLKDKSVNFASRNFDLTMISHLGLFFRSSEQ